MSAIVERPQPVFAELKPPLGHDAALVEADRCLECGGPYAAAPCVVACPAGVDVPAFVAAIARDEPDVAAPLESLGPETRNRFAFTSCTAPARNGTQQSHNLRRW